jgi:hypothetical protein
MGPHVHKTTYIPLIDTALYVMLSMRASPLQGQAGGGCALVKWHRAISRVPFGWGPKKSRFPGPNPLPCNGFARIESITYKPYKS